MLAACVITFPFLYEVFLLQSNSNICALALGRLRGLFQMSISIGLYKKPYVHCLHKQV